MICYLIGRFNDWSFCAYVCVSRCDYDDCDELDSRKVYMKFFTYSEEALCLVSFPATPLSLRSVGIQPLISQNLGQLGSLIGVLLEH